MARRSLPAKAMMARVTLDDREAGRAKIKESSVDRASMTICPRLTVPDPWVQHRVENIDHQVDDDHEKDHEQDHALNDNEVSGAYGVQQQIAYTGIVENGLNNRDQSTKVGHLKAHHRKRRHERVAQHMLPEDQPLAQAFRPGGPNVILL